MERPAYLAKNRRQGIFWILTIPQHHFTPYPVPGSSWFIGQLEHADSGFVHWQCVISFSTKKSRGAVRELFGRECHCELTRSAAADDYVSKFRTAIAGTQFQFGVKPIRRNDPKDWEKIWDLAKSGDLESIPASVRVLSFRTLRAITAQYSDPLPMERKCYVFWGGTGLGKSRRAWAEGGMDSYPKDPRTKFWCGYRGQKHVIIDEFRGDIDVGHLLRWLDRYPIILEVKGGSVVCACTKIWITSNLSPREWYPSLDAATLESVLRRMEVIHFDSL